MTRGSRPSCKQRGHELAHARITPAEGRRVVVVADARVLGHRLEIADQRRGVQVVPAGRSEWLVHVQRDGAGAADPVETDAAVVEEYMPARRLGNGALDEILRAAQVGQAIHVLR